MKKQNIICLIIIVLCVLGVAGVIAFIVLNHDDSKDTDAYKFKTKYEAYNDIEGYLSLDIDEDNIIKYIEGVDAVELLNTGTGVIYFGYPSSNSARNIIYSLFSAAEENNIDTIYYLDIYNIRDEFEFSGSIIPSQTKTGSNSYYEIVEILDEYLTEYYVSDSSGNLYDTGVKRLYAPTVVVVSNGEVVAFHSGTLEGLTESDNLTDEQVDELTQVFVEMFSLIEESDTCSLDGVC